MYLYMYVGMCVSRLVVVCIVYTAHVVADTPYMGGQYYRDERCRSQWVWEGQFDTVECPHVCFEWRGRGEGER